METERPDLSLGPEHVVVLRATALDGVRCRLGVAAAFLAANVRVPLNDAGSAEGSAKHGFSLHAATRAAAADEQGREALLKYILRPPLANERLLPGPDGLVRIALKKPFSDGTVAVDLDPLSLLCRLVALVPAPRFHTVRYFGVLAAAAKWRSLVVPRPGPSQVTDAGTAPDPAPPCSAAPCSASGSHYRPWAELLRRTFAVDVEICPRCGGRMRLLAVIANLAQVARFLHHRREPTEPPAQAPPRDPPFFKTLVVRRRPRLRELPAGGAVRGALNPEDSTAGTATCRSRASPRESARCPTPTVEAAAARVTRPFRGGHWVAARYKWRRSSRATPVQSPTRGLTIVWNHTTAQPSSALSSQAQVAPTRTMCPPRAVATSRGGAHARVES